MSKRKDSKSVGRRTEPYFVHTDTKANEVDKIINKFIENNGLGNSFQFVYGKPSEGKSMLAYHYFVYPGPRNHNGLLFEDAPEEEGVKTLELI